MPAPSRGQHTRHHHEETQPGASTLVSPKIQVIKLNCAQKKNFYPIE
jgi:hypothetical protein